MTCPNLPPPNRLIFSLQLLGLEILQAGRRLSRRAGYHRPVAIAEHHLQPPDTVAAESARSLVDRVASPALANHSHRSFIFAAALAQHRQVHVDQELLYIALMLHDLGLTEHHQGAGTFEVRGGNAAHAFCLEQGMASGRADAVQEAIVRHTSALTSFRAPQIALVQLGAAVDVIGYHIEDVAPETVAHAVASHPRLHLKRVLPPLLEREAEMNPEMIVALQNKLGFGGRIQQAPFAE